MSPTNQARSDRQTRQGKKDSQPRKHENQIQERYRAPRECPVCAERLQVTQLGCEACGTGISGSFESCDFCALDAADLDVLRVFLSSRGNMKELERHLGVSYPTARGRYDELVRKLGLVTTPDADPTPVPADLMPTDSAPSPSTTPGTAATADQGERLAALRALANGELDIEQATRLITG